MNNSGYSILEIMLASAMLLILTTVFAGALVSGQENVRLSSMRSRATLQAHEGLEAVRNIKEHAFANLVDGTFGLSSSTGEWTFAGGSDTTRGFTRTIEISSIDQSTKLVKANVIWQENPSRQSSTTLAAYLSNWSELSQESQGISIDTSSASMSGDNKEIRDIVIKNSGAANVTLTHMAVIWNNSRKIERLKIDSDTVWTNNGPGLPSGKQSSPAQLDIQDFIIEGGKTVEIENMKFDGSMAGTTLTITLTFADSSTKQFIVF